MKRIINILGILIAISLIIVTSPAFARMKYTNKDQTSSPHNGHTLRPAVGSLNYRDFFHDLYYDIERFSHLRVDDIFIGRFIISIDDNLIVSTSPSETMTTRITFGDSDIKVLPDTEGYNLGLGLTTLLRDGLSIDTSVNFALSNPSDLTFWVFLRPIRF